MATAHVDGLNLEVATPLGLALKASVENVQAPSVSGEFGVLPGHLPLLASLKSGILKYKSGGKDHVAAIGPGFVEAGPEKVIVLTDKFVTAADVDVEAARKELATAEEKLRALVGENITAEQQELQRDAEWAQAQLDLASLGAN